MLATNTYPEPLKYIYITVKLMQKRSENTTLTLRGVTRDVMYNPSATEKKSATYNEAHKS